MSAIDYHRARHDRQLRDSCTLLRPQDASDGGGGTIPAAPLRIGPLPCAFRATSGSEAAADLVVVRGSYRLTLPVTICDPDRGELVVPVATDEIEYAGAVYHILWAPPPSAQSVKRVLGLTEKGSS